MLADKMIVKRLMPKPAINQCQHPANITTQSVSIGNGCMQTQNNRFWIKQKQYTVANYHKIMQRHWIQ